jgi:hypothetical protein
LKDVVTNQRKKNNLGLAIGLGVREREEQGGGEFLQESKKNTVVVFF